MARVELTQAIKRYGDVQVIHGLDLHIPDGSFCVFVGPSGCGKSTLLRMIAGLEETTEGVIEIGERNVTHTDPAERGVAMVFQTYALYPHMTVEENMGFGLKMNKTPKAEIDEKVGKAAEILKLGPYMDRRPKALSGGQRQRVAIGRAIVRGPDVFLFDEPLSNLDAELRLEMRVELSRLHQELGTTMIYVTHDQVEAMTLADQIVVLRDGRIEQVGAPLELYENPANRFVAGFIGSPSMNFMPATVAKGKTNIGDIKGESLTAPKGLDGEVTLGVRPEAITVKAAKDGLKVALVEQLGGVSYVYLSLPSGGQLVAELRGTSAVKEGDSVTVSFNAKDALYFDPNTEARLA